MVLKYDDFDIQIEAVGEKYRVRVLNAPMGQASAEFVLPFTDVEVSNFLGRIGQVRRTMRRVDAPELQAAKEFGGKLFSAVFSGEMIAQLRGSMEQASEKEHGLRIRLRLTDVPALADLPWEFLYDANQNHFLTTSTETPVVRFLDLPQRIAPLRVTLPLRVLVVIAGPRNLKRLDADGEWERLQESLGDLVQAGQIVLERLPEATLDALRLRARGAPFHIFHFIGHGGFDEAAQDGVLQFEDESGMSYPVRGELLGMQLHDHRSLRLAVLNACEGARSSRQDPFSGVAQSLLQQRVPAVIAMQFEISDAAAKVFAQEFYRAVAEGNPVDAAVCESRKALFKEEFGQEWATPVLYMRAPEGQLFELQAVAPPPLPDPEKKKREAEEAAAKAEAERLAAQKADAERQAAQKAETERAAKLAKERHERAEQEEAAREKAEAAAKVEAELKARKKADAERAAAAKAEAERQAAEEVAAQRKAAQKATAERVAQLYKEHLLREQEERERLAREKAEAERTAAAKAEEQRQARQKEEAERRTREQAGFAQLQREKEAVEGAAREKREEERAVPQPSEDEDKHRRRRLWTGVAVVAALVVVVWTVLHLVPSKLDAQELFQKGETLRAQSNLAGAIAQYRDAIRLKPDYPEAHAALGIALRESGDLDGALKEFREATRLNPQNAETHYDLANALDGKANHDAAVAEYREVLRLDPGFAATHPIPELPPLTKPGSPVDSTTEAPQPQPSHPSGPPKPPTRVHRGGNVQAAQLINQVKPHYPAEAAQKQVFGTVRLHAIISKDGSVDHVSVLSGPPLLTESAVSAVKQWRYRPTLLNGRPVEVDTTIDVVYTAPVAASTAGPAPQPGPPATGNPQPANPPQPPADKPVCAFGKIEFSEQGNRLVGKVPYTYQGKYDLDAVAIRGVPVDKDRHLIPDLKYEQTSLQTASGTAYFAVESRPTLSQQSHPERESLGLIVAVVLKQTGATVCGELVPYQRKW